MRGAAGLGPVSYCSGVRVRWVTSAAALGCPDLIVLPGSKSTLADLAWLRERRLADAIVAAAAAGRPVLGVCGGYQMLGRALLDPDGVESSTASARGLGLLPVETVFVRDKTTVRVRARATGAPGPFERAAGVLTNAYEIHAGVTRLLDPTVARPLAVVARGGLAVEDRDGAADATGTVTGTYLHGIFQSGAARRALLGWLAARSGARRAPSGDTRTRHAAAGIGSPISSRGPWTSRPSAVSSASRSERPCRRACTPSPWLSWPSRSIWRSAILPTQFIRSPGWDGRSRSVGADSVAAGGLSSWSPAARSRSGC